MLLSGAVQQLIGFALPDLKMVVHRIQPAEVVIREFQSGGMILHACRRSLRPPCTHPPPLSTPRWFQLVDDEGKHAHKVAGESSSGA
jgi:hypothetical protein